MDQALFSPKDFHPINSLSRHNKEMKVENHHLSGPRSLCLLYRSESKGMSTRCDLMNRHFFNGERTFAVTLASCASSRENEIIF